jgi:hypothetical protein
MFVMRFNRRSSMAMRKTETVKVPTKREVRDGAKQTRRGHSSGAKVLNDQKQAIKQGKVAAKKH